MCVIYLIGYSDNYSVKNKKQLFTKNLQIAVP